MNEDQILKLFVESKEGILEEEDIIYVKTEVFRGTEWRFYQCPCLEEGHLAMRSNDRESLFPVSIFLYQLLCVWKAVAHPLREGEGSHSE